VADRYLLLGEKTSNSPTPRMMNAAFEALGLNAVYEAYNIEATGLSSAFANLKNSGVSGLNVTIPHKVSILQFLDSLDPVSTKIEAVNTVKREGASYRGFNTDVDGILQPLKSKGFMRIKHACVLGTGGAARAFFGAMHDLGCTELTVISRDPRKGAGFVSSMSSAFPEMRIEIDSTDHLPNEPAELFFNASPAGANGISLPEGVERVLDEKTTVFDAVYFPVETELIGLAKEVRCPIIYGHEMLLYQCLKSLQIWTHQTPPAHLVRKVLFDFLKVVTE
jgi:shikimate dehydrogenase